MGCNPTRGINDGRVGVQHAGVSMPGAALRSSIVIFGLLLVGSGCGSGDPTVQRLSERLESLTAVGRPELSRDLVEQALVRQMRVAPVPASGEKDASHPAFPTRETLVAFYANNGHRLAWSDDSGSPRPAAGTLLDALRRASEHGLNPEDYDLSRLDELRAQSGRSLREDATIARLADFDLLMTAACLRYASDLSTGRVHPDEIHEDWHTNRPELDPLTKLAEALRGNTLSELLERLPPPHAGYGRLRTALQELRRVAAAGGWPALPEGPTLATGSRDSRVALLRKRLVGSGTEPEASDEPQAAMAELYDGPMADLVRRFQERHGIEPDGEVGAGTLAELNVTVEQRMRQLELNLERWRWIPRQLGDPHVLVNIPGFDLELVREGTVVWHTRVVTGKAYTPTPVFSDQIVSIVVNPPWNVPESIARNEYLSELQEDPKAFQKRGFELIDGSGEDARVVDLKRVDFHALDKSNFPYRIRQKPGPINALGRLKFHLTNDYNIYLHDTPSRGLFERTERDLSHGCIRVEQPIELAEQLLDESSRVIFRQTLETAAERHLVVRPQVPVHILYLTARVDEAGSLRFVPDVYELDASQRASLDREASRVSGGPASGAKRVARPASP